MAEVHYDGVGVPVDRPRESVSGSEFTLTEATPTFTNSTAPGEIEVGTTGAGLPVGISNRPGVFAAPPFNNRGVIIDQVVPAAGPPGGNATVVSFFTTPINVGNR